MDGELAQTGKTMTLTFANRKAATRKKQHTVEEPQEYKEDAKQSEPANTASRYLHVM